MQPRDGALARRAYWTFGFWGELAWEIDRLVSNRLLRVLLAPALKLMARLSLVTKASEGRGNVLIVARKPEPRVWGSEGTGVSPADT